MRGHPLSGPDPTSPTKKEVKHRFEITKKLGSGTYGKVSLAFDHKFERERKDSLSTQTLDGALLVVQESLEQHLPKEIAQQ
ncbi:hypothetical protein ANCCEY_04105 [Ancylostoma ceylanicum]|uniref:Protein kinase domain-containing protein n=1 Tax=Ancylostoma ceylanicum TaxID=53326 RepID=A0A0D6M048_9BILA|nr:hypothetical protein ANCCEY_04105 [Ancylostoma ceylanicum]